MTRATGGRLEILPSPSGLTDGAGGRGWRGGGGSGPAGCSGNKPREMSFPDIRPSLVLIPRRKLEIWPF